jgi:hypothetical protein
LNPDPIHTADWIRIQYIRIRTLRIRNPAYN